MNQTIFLPRSRPLLDIFLWAVLEPDKDGEEQGESNDSDADDHRIHGLAQLFSFVFLFILLWKVTSLSELQEEKVNNIALTVNTPALVYTSLLPESKTEFENIHDFDIRQWKLLFRIIS